jgi:hypothetical protein
LRASISQENNGGAATSPGIVSGGWNSEWGIVMDQGPLVTEQIDAGARFLEEFKKRIPVKAAFWLKVGEEDSWYLYVVPEQFHATTMRDGYNEVGRIAQEMRDPDFDQFQVKLIKPGDALARAAHDYLQLYPGSKPIRLRRRIFGDMGTEEVYVYPNPVTASSIEAN